MILTGRAVAADEALAIGLANRVVPAGQALEARARASRARSRASRRPACATTGASVMAQSGRPFDEAMAHEFELGERSLASGESVSGARRFAEGVGRHGAFPADG